jgi:hypothetical protein
MPDDNRHRFRVSIPLSSVLGEDLSRYAGSKPERLESLATMGLALERMRLYAQLAAYNMSDSLIGPGINPGLKAEAAVPETVMAPQPPAPEPDPPPASPFDGLDLAQYTDFKG